MRRIHDSWVPDTPENETEEENEEVGEEEDESESEADKSEDDDTESGDAKDSASYTLKDLGNILSRHTIFENYGQIVKFQYQ